MNAGFGIVAAHPIKAEMSVATPKHQAKEPIDLDIIIVCRKRATLIPRTCNGDLWGLVAPAAGDQVGRLQARGRTLSRNDVRVIVMGQLLRQLSLLPTVDTALTLLDSVGSKIESVIWALSVRR